MKKIDFDYICTVIGNLAGIPIRVFENSNQIFYHSLVRLPADPIKPYLCAVLEIKNHIGYFITPYFNYYGVVCSEPYKIIIGPTRQSAMNDQDIKALAFKCDVAPDDVDEFVSAMKSIVQMPLSSIVQMLCTINYVMNGEKLSLEDIVIYDTEQQNLKELIETARTNQNFNSAPLDIQAQRTVHNTLELEQTLTNIVRKGDTSAV